jgi:hypothetical protein
MRLMRSGSNWLGGGTGAPQEELTRVELWCRAASGVGASPKALEADFVFLLPPCIFVGWEVVVTWVVVVEVVVVLLAEVVKLAVGWKVW